MFFIILFLYSPSFFFQIRNGFGKFDMGERQVSHSFDAFSKITKISLNGTNRGLFSYQFLETEYYQQSQQKDTIAPFMLFEQPQPEFSFIERLQALWHGVDNTNVNVIYFREKDQFAANSDFWVFYELNGTDLNTIGKASQTVPGNPEMPNQVPLSSTSHPIKAYRSSDYISFVAVPGTTPWEQSHINVVRLTSINEHQVIASIPRDQVPYMHSFALSQNYAILMGNPAFVNEEMVLLTGNPVTNIDWKPELGADIYAVHIHTGRMTKFHTPVAEFNLHAVNAWEEEHQVKTVTLFINAVLLKIKTRVSVAIIRIVITNSCR